MYEIVGMRERESEVESERLLDPIWVRDGSNVIILMGMGDNICEDFIIFRVDQG
jgi:hypothetical protein